MNVKDHATWTTAAILLGAAWLASGCGSDCVRQGNDAENAADDESCVDEGDDVTIDTSGVDRKEPSPEAKTPSSADGYWFLIGCPPSACGPVP